MASRLASNRRRASGKRMGNESVCVLGVLAMLASSSERGHRVCSVRSTRISSSKYVNLLTVVYPSLLLPIYSSLFSLSATDGSASVFLFRLLAFHLVAHPVGLLPPLISKCLVAVHDSQHEQRRCCARFREEKRPTASASGLCCCAQCSRADHQRDSSLDGFVALVSIGAAR
jgi:hypothetical protein